MNPIWYISSTLKSILYKQNYNSVKNTVPSKWIKKTCRFFNIFCLRYFHLKKLSLIYLSCIIICFLLLNVCYFLSIVLFKFASITPSLLIILIETDLFELDWKVTYLIVLNWTYVIVYIDTNWLDATYESSSGKLNSILNNSISPFPPPYIFMRRNLVKNTLDRIFRNNRQLFVTA